jgi:hypothetical protein
VKACEVGINVAVKVQIASGLDDYAHVASAVKIADERFDGGRVASYWAVAMSGRVLVDK